MKTKARETAERAKAKTQKIYGLIKTVKEKWKAKCSELRSEIRTLRRDLKYWQRRAEQLTRRIAEEKAQELAKRLKHGKKAGWFTDRGGLGTALRRCMTNAAAATFGLALATDFSRQTLCCWEI